MISWAFDARHQDLQAAETGDAAHQGIDHGLREGASQRGVKRVAAVLQGARAGFNGIGLRRDDHGLGHRCHPFLVSGHDRPRRAVIQGSIQAAGPVRDNSVSVTWLAMTSTPFRQGRAEPFYY